MSVEDSGAKKDGSGAGAGADGSAGGGAAALTGGWFSVA